MISNRRRTSTRRSFCLVALLTILVSLVSGGCKKNPAVVRAPTPGPSTPDAPPTPAAPDPTISLSASPTTIARGESATLMWNATNASSVTIDGGIGTVEVSASRTVSPTTSTTYTATATGGSGQRRSSSARITVTEASSPIPTSSKTLRTEEFFATRVHDVFFDYDSYDLRDDARRTLDENARALAERTEIRFIIEGHADERGSERYNLALADRRANTAMQYLLSKGLAGERIETISYGEERPIEQGHNEEAWAKNRRAHFVLK